MITLVSFESSVVPRASQVTKLSIVVTLETEDVAFVCWRVILAFFVLLVVSLDGLPETVSSTIISLDWSLMIFEIVLLIMVNAGKA